MKGKIEKSAQVKNQVIRGGGFQTAVSQPPSPPLPQVELKVEQQDAALSNLEDRMTVLEARLALVLVDVPETAGADGAETCLCRLASALHGHNCRIESLISRVNGLLNRIEL